MNEGNNSSEEGLCCVLLYLDPISWKLENATILLVVLNEGDTNPSHGRVGGSSRGACDAGYCCRYGYPQQVLDPPSHKECTLQADSAVVLKSLLRDLEQ